jgi:hypothetical protein
MAARVLMRLFIALSVIAVGGGLAYVYIAPPESMRLTRDGVPHFSPPVAHPMTGEAIPMERLVRHYKGERP